MQPVPQDRLIDLLTPIGEQFLAETGTANRFSVAYAIGRVNEGYELRTAAAYVNDLENPKSCLIVRLGSSWMTPAPSCLALWYWVSKEARGAEAIRLEADMIKTLEAFAALNNCESIYASSWVYMGNTDISPIWAKNGFDLQEKMFIKLLSDD